MSLTQHLRDPHSPIYLFLQDVAPQLALAGTRGLTGKNAALALHFDHLMAHQLDVPVPRDVTNSTAHSAVVGTAFDYRARMMLGPFDTRNTVARLGLQEFGSTYSRTHSEREMARELSKAFKDAEKLCESNRPADRDKASIVFAWCEDMFRSGVSDFMKSQPGGQLIAAVKERERSIDSINPLQLEDLRALRLAASSQIAAWRAEISAGATYNPNPTFDGSVFVGGADADWIVGDTLIDCKTTKKLANHWIRKSLFQVLGYALLDFKDKLGVRKLGLWLPRYGALETWTLDEILCISSDRELRQVRRQFKKLLTR